MKRKIFGILFAVVLIMSFSLVPSTPAIANSEASSTMHFSGNLTYQGGVFTGTVNMTQGTYYAMGGAGYSERHGCTDTNPCASGPGGFDVYAKVGGTAYVQGTGSYTIGGDHDAYSQSGPWGTWYTPDCADWCQYELVLTADNWSLRYKPTSESPMSGNLTWYGGGTAYAAETDLGTQDGSHGGSAAQGGGAQAWDWDCGWGIEVIPLQYPGFDVTVTGSSPNYQVTLTPAGAGSTALTAEVPDIVAISVSPTSIDFGALLPGDTSAEHEIDVENIGTHEVDVDVEVDGAALFEDYLQMHDSIGSWATSGGDNIWPNMVSNLAMDVSDKVWTRLPVPSGYTPVGEETATLIFTAAASP